VASAGLARGGGQDLLATCEQVVAELRGRGVDAACAVRGRTRGVSLEWRDGRVESIEQHTNENLRIEAYRDGRYAAGSTSDLRAEAVQQLVADVVELTRVLEPDPCRALPDPSLYARSEIDLELEDPGFAGRTSEARRSVVCEMEAQARRACGPAPVVSVSTGLSESRGESARVHSNGFVGVRSGTQFSRYASVTLADRDGRRQLGHATCVRRHCGDLEPAEQTAAQAARRACAQLGAGKLATGRYTTLVDHRAMGRLVGALLAPLSGGALYQRRSLWDGLLGQPIASPGLTLVDEPHRPRGLGSALWDGDGIGTQRRVLIEGGVLRSYLIDVYAARKLGVSPTGGDTHNLLWQLGPRSQAELLREVGDGVLIEQFLGGNSNGATGAVSLGCSGHAVRGGERAEPIAEFNLAGNLRTLFGALIAQGNDPDPSSPFGAPTCVFDAVQLSGV
jgi:PmbA protein